MEVSAVTDDEDKDRQNPPSDPHDVYWKVQVAEARRDDPGAGRGLLSTIIGFIEREQPLPPSLRDYLVEILRAGLAATPETIGSVMHIERDSPEAARDRKAQQRDQGTLDDFEMI